ncbi:hypothetical protein AAY473_021824 [Plecturocebus cupreus]
MACCGTSPCDPMAFHSVSKLECSVILLTQPPKQEGKERRIKKKRWRKEKEKKEGFKDESTGHFRRAEHCILAFLSDISHLMKAYRERRQVEKFGVDTALKHPDCSTNLHVAPSA